MFSNQSILATIKIGIEEPILLENTCDTPVLPIQTMSRHLDENTSTDLLSMLENNHKRLPKLPEQHNMLVYLGIGLLTSNMAIYRRPLTASSAGSRKEQRVMGTPETLSGDQPTRWGSEVFTLRDLNDVKIVVVPGRASNEVVRLTTSLDQVIHSFNLLNLINGVTPMHSFTSNGFNYLLNGLRLLGRKLNKRMIQDKKTHVLTTLNMNVAQSDHHTLTTAS
jgi:hypothetical protein